MIMQGSQDLTLINNIYNGSVDVGKLIYRDYNKNWDDQLDEALKDYQSQGYTVVFVFLANPVQDIAKPVLYPNPESISWNMRHYTEKYVKFNGHWVIQSQLNMCDECGEYAAIKVQYNGRYLCDDCARKVRIIL